MKTMTEIRIDRTKTLVEEPGTGHNRWHPDIPPVIRCQPGDEVILETRDAFDGQMGPDVRLDVVAAPNLDVVHPLTGPVYVEGAEPGDLLDVEILDIEPDSYAWTRGWDPDDVAAARARLVDRGLIDDDGALTPAGAELRERVERTTDHAARVVVERLGDGAGDLFDLLAPIAGAMTGAGGYPESRANLFG